MPSGSMTASPPLGKTELHLLDRGGVLFDLGIGCRALPVNNSEYPGSVPCPITFPTGLTSKSLGSAAAATLCLNKKPGFPRSPTTFLVVFPSGDYTLGGLVQDENSPNSPDKNIAIANWIVIHAQ